MCKRILDLNFNWSVTNKISNFHEIAPNSHIHKLQFFMHNWKLIDQLLLPYKFHGSGISGLYFSILPIYSKSSVLQYPPPLNLQISEALSWANSLYVCMYCNNFLWMIYMKYYVKYMNFPIHVKLTYSYITISWQMTNYPSYNCASILNHTKFSSHCLKKLIM